MVSTPWLVRVFVENRVTFSDVDGILWAYPLRNFHPSVLKFDNLKKVRAHQLHFIKVRPLLSQESKKVLCATTKCGRLITAACKLTWPIDLTVEIMPNYTELLVSINRLQPKNHTILQKKALFLFVMNLVAWLQVESKRKRRHHTTLQCLELLRGQYHRGMEG